MNSNLVMMVVIIIMTPGCWFVDELLVVPLDMVYACLHRFRYEMTTTLRRCHCLQSQGPLAIHIRVMSLSAGWEDSV